MQKRKSIHRFKVFGCIPKNGSGTENLLRFGYGVIWFHDVSAAKIFLYLIMGMLWYASTRQIEEDFCCASQSSIVAKTVYRYHYNTFLEEISNKIKKCIIVISDCLSTLFSSFM